MCYVYILFSQKIKKYYVGTTDDLARRLEQHNTGRSGFTKIGMPWDLVVSFEFTNKTEAIKMEFKIKKRGIERYLRDKKLL